MMDHALLTFISAIVYVALWLWAFALAVYMTNRLIWFSLRKEIVEDENLSLWILLAGIFIALGIIIGSVLQG